jgi:hypothetical protein
MDDPSRRGLPKLRSDPGLGDDAGMLRRFGSPAFLWAGVIAPILFTSVYLVEGATRPGYDPIRHQVSLLSLGDGGWVQVVSFLVNGPLLIGFAIAMRARLGDGSGALAGPVALGLAGLGLIVAGLFSSQPLFGYPPGTRPGMATEVTPTSLLHVFGAFLLIFGIIAAAMIFARRFRQAGAVGWAVASFGAGLVVFVSFGASGGGPSGELLFPEVSGLLQRIALVTGLGWVAALASSEIAAARS